MIEVFVNGEPVHIPKGSNVMAACDAAGIDIPRFCYHQRLSIAGNCRMCLVEVEKVPKPVASCAMPAGPGMKIKTGTPLVMKAREGVMEFLLANHPLDCPICDQGGECDLQDQAMHFGSDRGRHTEIKRSVADKNLGPLVKTVMTRCIHCTRCVRFATEVAGVPDLGVTGRGRDAEIGTYVERMLTSELSGNVIDLCPVGALTSKPAAFTYRNWELKATETIDVSDALGAAIRVDARGPEVMRIMPRQNDAVNEEWLHDRARFQFDGLKRQRLTIPMVKKGKSLQPSAWSEALQDVADAMQGVPGNQMLAIAGRLSDAESMVSLKDLMNRLGCGNIKVEAGFHDLDADVRSNYLVNSGVAGVDEADAILIIGSNPRKESPVFNARIRKSWLGKNTPIAVIGEAADLTYPYAHLGDGPEALSKLVAGGKGSFMETLAAAKRPMVLVGPGLLLRADRDAVLQKVHELVEKANIVKESDGSAPAWNGYNVLHEAASRVAALDIGFLPSARARASKVAPKFVYLLGSDDFDEADIPADAFVVYQGHHGDRGATRADVILPGAAYTEKSGSYVNMEGRVQETRVAVPVPGDARDDWKIIRALSEVLGKTLPYDDRDGLKARLVELAPHLATADGLEVQSPLWLNGQYFKAFASRAGKAPSSGQPFSSPVDNFYMRDAISRASQTMAKCVMERQRADATGIVKGISAASKSGSGASSA